MTNVTSVTLTLEELAVVKDAAYKQGIVEFVGKMSADYRKHNALAVKEDILAAVAFFDIPTGEFYTDPHQREVTRAEAEVYKLTGGVS